MSINELRQLPEVERTELFVFLEKMYSDLDEDLQKLENPCTACGNCCNFKLAEHRLYISSLEFEWLNEKYKSDKDIADDICPFMREQKCTVRDRRMIGCRTYFRLHTQKNKESAEGLYEKYLNLLKEKYQQKKISWQYMDFMGYLK